MYMIYVSFKGVRRYWQVSFANSLESAIQGARFDYAVKNNIDFLNYSDITASGHAI